MNEEDRPPLWQVVKQAVEALGGKTTNVAVRDWILSKYPGTNANSVSCHIILCTVNHPSRIHYLSNKEPRIADGKYDFLFRPERGHVELYDPEVHGVWEIFEGDDGRPSVRQRDDGVGEGGRLPAPRKDEDAPAEEGDAFAEESHLRDYLAQHLETVEEGLQLYADEDGNAGVEYQTPIGRIDILAVDRNDDFVVIELKVSRGSDAVSGQLLRYRSWVKRHLAEGRAVRGVIIANSFSDRVRYSLADIDDVTLMKYELSITLHRVPNLDES